MLDKVPNVQALLCIRCARRAHNHAALYKLYDSAPFLLGAHNQRGLYRGLQLQKPVHQFTDQFTLDLYLCHMQA